ncbi:hypothetical protein TNCV_1488341 [Trichonephila clavipes]|nr:hypothetical protein TNCV_1488341 [Trichonephila clavipes]
MATPTTLGGPQHFKTLEIVRTMEMFAHPWFRICFRERIKSQMRSNLFKDKPSTTTEKEGNDATRNESENPVLRSIFIHRLSLVILEILLWSPWKYRCGQRTVRMAVMACSQKQRSLRKAQAELKLKLVN